MTAWPPGRRTRRNSPKTVSRSWTCTSTSRHQIRVGAGVRVGDMFGDTLVDADAAGDLRVGGGEGFQGASGGAEGAVDRFDAMHREPEPAGQLDAVLAFAGSDVQGG